jgi:hypothetical protein
LLLLVQAKTKEKEVRMIEREGGCQDAGDVP